MKSFRCPRCGIRGGLSDFQHIDIDGQVQNWRVWLQENGHWVSPDNRVKTATAALLLCVTEGTLREWRVYGKGPEYGGGKIKTYSLEALAEWHLKNNLVTVG